MSTLSHDESRRNGPVDAGSIGGTSIRFASSPRPASSGHKPDGLSAGMGKIADSFNEHPGLIPMEDVEGYVTLAFLELIDRSAPPSPALLRQKLLALLNMVIKNENLKIAKGDLRHSAQRSLSNWQVAQIMLHLHQIIRIAPSKGSFDKEYDMLAMYVPSGPDEGIYTTSENEIRLVARQYVTHIKLTDVKEVLAVLKDGAPRRNVCRDRDIVAVNNGVFFYSRDDRLVDIDGAPTQFRAKSLRPFDPSLVFLSKSRVDYDPNATSPSILMHDGLTWDIESWLADLSDEEGIPELLWEILGAIIRPHVSWNKSAWFFSELGNNGKGTLCLLMRKLVGDGSHTSIPLSAMGMDFALEPLMHVSAIIVDENDVGTFIDKAANLKTIVTNDVLQINRKYRTPVAFQFHGFMVQCLNELPRVKDKSESFYRRQLFVPFAKSFTGVERRYIKDDYLQRPEVLRYVLKRVLLDMDYYELSEPEATKIVLAEYKEYNDPVRAFWEEFRGRFIWDLLPFSFLYDLYKAWFANVSPSGMPVSRQQFINDLIQILRVDDYWCCEDKKKCIRPTRLMMDPEPLIAQYELKAWLNSAYKGDDDLKRSKLTNLQPNYRGVLRRTAGKGAAVALPAAPSAEDSDGTTTSRETMP